VDLSLLIICVRAHFRGLATENSANQYPERPHSSLGDLAALEYISKPIEGNAWEADLKALGGPEEWGKVKLNGYDKLGQVTCMNEIFDAAADDLRGAT
jgi:hypothetical protein